ncbi:MAG: hypothetical protein P4L84_18885 [Isosphaeraceae bacterium]|nr:hypothetical protein [Isosphaeraceae bacterium]
MTHDSIDKTGLLRRLLFGSALVLGLSGNGAVTGASISTAAERPFDEDAHEKHCACGPKCRKESCCCGPVDAAREASVTPPQRSAPATEENPCLRGAPCHDPAAPSGPVVEVVPKALPHDLRRQFDTSPPWEPFPCAPSERAPARRENRLERPPKPALASC